VCHVSDSTEAELVTYIKCQQIERKRGELAVRSCIPGEAEVGSTDQRNFILLSAL